MNPAGLDINATMQKWQGAINDVLHMLLNNPDNEIVFWIFLVSAYLACRWAFVKVVYTMNLNDLGVVKFHITTLLGLAAIVVPMAAVRIYSPEWYTSADKWLYIGGIVVGASLFLSIPLINAMLKENYFRTLIAWGTGMLAMVAAMFIMGVIVDAFFHGVDAYKKGYERNEETKKVVK